MELSQLEQELGISFQQKKLLKEAFTHSSYVNEYKKSKLKDNERLEFLGDAVLELAVSQYLYRNNQEMPEGEMTKLRAAIVCEASLTVFAKQFNFGQYILLGKGEDKTGGRQRPAILADAFEAFLGALYLDQGFDTVLCFLNKHIFPVLTVDASTSVVDYKSHLQEIVQQQKDRKIEYQIIDEHGPSHHKEFIAEVLIQGEPAGKGIGRTKKEAEQKAARAALEKKLPE
ncbi:ribonuclease III [Oceanobacillus jeddahense]|uniref:Ribonuclease 3 n=1 Tax=Oceanobacillus jeddahense TaxID=1462527 RepID=A0ABY5JP28_9BACI|nr:ribonuclease III [Oceanobacillus jeddahense]UUI01570.1 ribonuclease III [Oceanobacillus jeddahense]